MVKIGNKIEITWQWINQLSVQYLIKYMSRIVVCQLIMPLGLAWKAIQLWSELDPFWDVLNLENLEIICMGWLIRGYNFTSDLIIFVFKLPRWRGPAFSEQNSICFWHGINLWIILNWKLLGNVSVIMLKWL